MITCSTVTAVIEALRETVAVSQTARLVLDSRRCQVGDVFVAAAGRTVDGRDYFADAVAKGVAAIVFESSLTPAQQEALGGTPAVAVVGLTALLGSLADTWWDHPSRALTVIAITGTTVKQQPLIGCRRHLISWDAHADRLARSVCLIQMVSSNRVS